MTGDNIKNNTREEMARGDHTLTAAETLIASKFYNDAVSRAYYAMLYYARALLLTKGLEAKSHYGTYQLLNLHFIKDGHLAAVHGSNFAHVQSYRELSDYEATTVFDEAQARQEIETARKFMAACRELVKKACSDL